MVFAEKMRQGKREKRLLEQEMRYIESEIENAERSREDFYATQTRKIEHLQGVLTALRMLEQYVRDSEEE